MPLDIDTALAWRGKTVRDADGEKVGTFGDVYLDRRTDLPAWGGVRTGLFGRHESFVPLARARLVDDELRLPYAGQLVRDAPRVDPDVALTTEEERRLFDHYGEREDELTGGEEHRDVVARHEGAGSAHDEGAGGPGEERADPIREEGAAEVVRSEEEVHVGPSEPRPVERVRLRKVRVTENVTTTVPRRREVVQLEHEPPPEGRIEGVEDVPPTR